ncbi:MAG: hypothetical protein AABY22_32670 [Nanoarchaeota archaeon]|mgnify:CR=1 FL=1
MVTKNCKRYEKKDINDFISSQGNGVFKGFSKFYPSRTQAERAIWKTLKTMNNKCK